MLDAAERTDQPATPARGDIQGADLSRAYTDDALHVAALLYCDEPFLVVIIPDGGAELGDVSRRDRNGPTVS